KCLDPTSNITWQRGWSWNQSNKTHAELLRLQSSTIFFNIRKIPWIRVTSMDAASIKRLDQRHFDFCDATFAAQFTDKTAPPLERAPHTCDDRVSALHPMQSGVAE